MEIKFDWDDIIIKPTAYSDIESRSEINLNRLPLIVSPMDTVIDENNANVFHEMGYTVCMPRGTEYRENLKDHFFSFGVDDMKKLLLKEDTESIPNNILIDVANGNMSILFDIIRKIKEKNENIILMVGNIANPETFKLLSESGADFIRCGIGNGGGCLTTQQLGIGMPMGSLIEECREIKEKYNLKAEIIADGGFRKYSDVIKALALGSYSVMLGSILNKTLESCTPKYLLEKDIYSEISDTKAEKLFKDGENIYSYFRGMSTKEVQKKWGKKKLTTSEGITKYNKVEYTLSGWTENFRDYLKSAMSYCGKREISNFIGNVEYVHMTQQAFNRFNK